MTNAYAIGNKNILTDMGADLKDVLTNLFGTKTRYAMPKVSKKTVEDVFANILQYAETRAEELSAKTGLSAEYLLDCVGHNPEMINDFRQEYLHAQEDLEAIATIKTAAKKKAINLKNLTSAELKAVKLYATGKLDAREKYLIALTENPLLEFADAEINGLNAALGAAAMRELVPSHYRSPFEDSLSAVIGTDIIANITTSKQEKSIWTEEAATAHLLSKGIPPRAAKKIIAVLLIAGIVLASGCADVTAPSTTTIDSLDAAGYYNQDINDAATQIAQSSTHTDTDGVYEKGGMIIQIDSYDNGEIYAISITDQKQNTLQILDNSDANGDIIDEVWKDGNLVPKPTAEPVDDNQKAYGEVLELWANTEKGLANIDQNYWLNTENKPGKFYVGLELDTLKDVKQIKLHTGGHVFDYRLAGTETNDDGSLSYIWFEDINAQGDPFDTKISFGADKDNINYIDWTTDFDRDGELDVIVTDELADGRNLRAVGK